MQNENAKTAHLREAESAFKAAASAQAFVDSCDKLRQLSTEHSEAQATLDTATREAEQKLVPVHLDSLKSAGRAARGIAGLGDLGRAIFSGKRSTAKEQVSDAVEAEASTEARLRNKLSIATDEFGSQQVAVLAAARLYVEARAEAEGATIDGDALDQAALKEVLQLPALQGLEDYLVPS